MIYITGDKHRIFDDIENFCEENCTTTDDVLIILGDAGINYEGEWHDTRLKRDLAQLPITLFCIHGNHEMRPETINSYEEVERFGGVVYMEEDFPNLLFAKDGEIFEFDGQRCIVIGGAYSVDKFDRTPGRDWWPDEQPDELIMMQVEERLAAEKWQIDVVLSHTCPMKYIPEECFLPGINQHSVDNSTEEWLDTIEKKLDYKDWYCGHFHTEKYSNKLRFMFTEILEFGEY